MTTNDDTLHKLINRLLDHFYLHEGSNLVKLNYMSESVSKAASEVPESFQRQKNAKDCQLGEGGFGRVYALRDTTMNRPVALKRINPVKTTTFHPWTSSTRSRFDPPLYVPMEIVYLAMCQNVPGVIKIMGFFCDDGRFSFYKAKDEKVEAMFEEASPTNKAENDVDAQSNPVWYILMERLENHEDLFDYISRHKYLKEDKAAHIFHQLLKTIRGCYSVGVMHRDLKDENIVLDSKTLQIRLIDFGSSTLLFKKTSLSLQNSAISTASSESRNASKKSHQNMQTLFNSTTSSAIPNSNSNLSMPFIIDLNMEFTEYEGTRVYSSPEWILRNRYCGRKLEVWSLGILLYNMVQGDIPFNSDRQIIFGKLGWPRPCSEEVRDLILQCLQANPLQREITIDCMEHHAWIAMNSLIPPSILQSSPFVCTSKSSAFDDLASMILPASQSSTSFSAHLSAYHRKSDSTSKSSIPMMVPEMPSQQLPAISCHKSLQNNSTIHQNNRILTQTQSCTTTGLSPLPPANSLESLTTITPISSGDQEQNSQSCPTTISSQSESVSNQHNDQFSSHTHQHHHLQSQPQHNSPSFAHSSSSHSLSQYSAQQQKFQCEAIPFSVASMQPSMRRNYAHSNLLKLCNPPNNLQSPHTQPYQHEITAKNC